MNEAPHKMDEAPSAACVRPDMIKLPWPMAENPRGESTLFIIKSVKYQHSRDPTLHSGRRCINYTATSACFSAGFTFSAPTTDLNALCVPSTPLPRGRAEGVAARLYRCSGALTRAAAGS